MLASDAGLGAQRGGISTAAQTPSLDHSLPLDRHKDSSSRDIERLVTFLDAELRKKAGFNGVRNAARRNLKVLLLNLYVHWRLDPALYTGISFNVASYKAKSRYNVLRISKLIIPIAKGLDHLGYVEHHIGFYSHDAPHHSRNSRIRPTAKLIALFRREAGSFNLNAVTRPEEEEIIILRQLDDDTGQKVAIEYDDTTVPVCVATFRTDLKRINSAFVLSKVVLSESLEANSELADAIDAGRIPDLTAKKLHRVFNNNSWEQGGRFYGAWWIAAPKRLRQHIQIGDENGVMPAVEIDFSGIHIDLLYAKHGIDYHKQVTDDP